MHTEVMYTMSTESEADEWDFCSSEVKSKGYDRKSQSKVRVVLNFLDV